MENAAPPLGLLADVEDSVNQVHVSPKKSDQFSAPQARGDGEDERGVQRVLT